MPFDVTTREGQFHQADQSFDLFTAAPANQSAALPAVLVAHAWDGLNEPIRAITERIAALGYVAVAAQLIGMLFFNVNTADAMISGLDWSEEDRAANRG